MIKLADFQKQKEVQVQSVRGGMGLRGRLSDDHNSLEFVRILNGAAAIQSCGASHT